jgi:hypothetical protein
MLLAGMTAWVLWMEVIMISSVEGPHWRPESGFETLEGCEKRGEERLIEELIRDRGDTKVLDTPVKSEKKIWLQRLDGQKASLRFACFPDTIDPRRPKP